MVRNHLSEDSIWEGIEEIIREAVFIPFVMIISVLIES